MFKPEMPWNLIKDTMVAKNLESLDQLSSRDVRDLREAQKRLLPIIQTMREAAVEAIAQATPMALLNMEKVIKCEYVVVAGAYDPVRSKFRTEEWLEHSVAMSLSSTADGAPLDEIFPKIEFGTEDNLKPGLLVYPRLLAEMEQFIRHDKNLLAMVQCSRPDDKQPMPPTFDVGSMRH